MIRLVGVAKRYGRGPFVVAGVDAEVRSGEVLVVHGGNGAGKSTLLRIVAGCLAPTRGRVLGRPATVGYVPDRFPARLRMPAGAYLRHLQRIRPAGTRDAAALLDSLRFRGGHDTPMSRLSKGNAQKVGLAQALCSGAPLLVLDEPWSGLDADARPVLTAALQRLVATGVAVVVSDHTRTAETLTGHLSVLLHDGGLTAANAGPHTNAGPRMVAGPRTVAVTVRCDRPDETADRLSGFGTAERHTGELSLRVPPGEVDALLIAALRLGCSVREVRECAD
jgi:ABC-type multidrug transport system ATPase subunit